MLLDRIVLALALGAAGIPAPAHAAEAEVIVDARQFRCLVNQIRSVPSEPRGVWVDIGDCTRRGPSIVRGFVGLQRQQIRGVDVILEITSDNLACVRRHHRNIAAIVEPRPQARYRLRWEPCPPR